MQAMNLMQAISGGGGVSSAGSSGGKSAAAGTSGEGAFPQMLAECRRWRLPSSRASPWR